MAGTPFVRCFFSEGFQRFGDGGGRRMGAGLDPPNISGQSAKTILRPKLNQTRVSVPLARGNRQGLKHRFLLDGGLVPEHRRGDRSPLPTPPQRLPPEEDVAQLHPTHLFGPYSTALCARRAKLQEERRQRCLFASDVTEMASPNDPPQQDSVNLQQNSKKN